jgi:Xaa-Pro dipeptidase
VDCTRVFALGKIDPVFKRAHLVSDHCHKLFLEKARRGAFIPDIHNEIIQYVSREGFADVFMGGVKFIGHGVGLDLDEFPIITENFKEYIQEGMVIAFEPKFIFEHGSAGYENTYYIVNEQVETLNHFKKSIYLL